MPYIRKVILLVALLISSNSVLSTNTVQAASNPCLNLYKSLKRICTNVSGPADIERCKAARKRYSKCIKAHRNHRRRCVIAATAL